MDPPKRWKVKCSARQYCSQGNQFQKCLRMSGFWGEANGSVWNSGSSWVVQHEGREEVEKLGPHLERSALSQFLYWQPSVTMSATRVWSRR